MAKSVLGRARKFLSSRFDEGSIVQWEVEQWGEETGRRRGAWAFLKIRDCDRSVRLDFDIDSEKERKQRLKKLDSLIHELFELRQRLLEAEVGDGK